jgi:two-component system, cell cycle response regulator DivK
MWIGDPRWRAPFDHSSSLSLLANRTTWSVAKRALDQRQRIAVVGHGMMKACSILLVDDYEDGLEMYEEYLTYQGFQVVVARNGDEAVARARSHRPDLILMDLRMPGMTGTEAMHILRADRSFVNTPIVALTAHALEGERRLALDAGFDELIAKPCLPDALVAAVERILNDRTPHSSPDPRDHVIGARSDLSN